MIKILRVFEFVWLAISTLSLLKVWELWGVEGQEQMLYIFAGFAILGVIMFFFRRRMRLKMEARKESSSPN